MLYLVKYIYMIKKTHMNLMTGCARHTHFTTLPILQRVPIDIYILYTFSF